MATYGWPSSGAAMLAAFLGLLVVKSDATCLPRVLVTSYGNEQHVYEMMDGVERYNKPVYRCDDCEYDAFRYLYFYGEGSDNWSINDNYNDNSPTIISSTNVEPDCPYEDDRWQWHYTNGWTNGWTNVNYVHISGIIDCGTTLDSSTAAYSTGWFSSDLTYPSFALARQATSGRATVSACGGDVTITGIRPAHATIDQQGSFPCNQPSGNETYTVAYTTSDYVIFDVGHYRNEGDFQVGITCFPDTDSPSTSAPTTNVPSTSAPTPAPTRTPTPAPSLTPTRHACNDNSHGCDQTEYGICEQIDTDAGYRCSCVPTHHCEPSCDTPNHVCVRTTSSPSTAPTSMPTRTPTLLPTAGPSQSPTTAPTTSTPTSGPSQSPSQSPSSTPSQSPSLSPSDTIDPQSSSAEKASMDTSTVIIIAVVGVLMLIAAIVFLIVRKRQAEQPKAAVIPPKFYVENSTFATKRRGTSTAMHVNSQYAANTNMDGAGPQVVYGHLNSNQGSMMAQGDASYASLESNTYDQPLSAGEVYSIPMKTNDGASGSASVVYAAVQPRNVASVGNVHVYDSPLSIPTSTLYSQPSKGGSVVYSAPMVGYPHESTSTDDFDGFGSAC